MQGTLKVELFSRDISERKYLRDLGVKDFRLLMQKNTNLKRTKPLRDDPKIRQPVRTSSKSLEFGVRPNP
jgi:hypothetical protein